MMKGRYFRLRVILTPIAENFAGLRLVRSLKYVTRSAGSRMSNVTYTIEF